LAAAGIAVLDTVTDPAFLKEIARKGEKIAAVLAGWKHPAVKEIRGRGLMTGIDIEVDTWPVLEACLAAGLLILSAGQKTLRLLPPFIIGDGEIEQGLALLKTVLDTAA
jgi:acetylornithine/succinyldiaminopimelate/putrescine aminotransferase